MPSRYLRGQGLRALALVLATAAAVPIGREAAAEPQPGLDPLGRVQLHRNSNRSVPYLPIGLQGESAGSASLVMRAARTIEFDGAPLDNVYGNVRPIDVDGDGVYEYLHYNGFRYAQVWSLTGTKLWKVENPDGRVHDMQDATQRDTVAILDLDGDGLQDIAHCWVVGGQRSLVYRRGLDGAVIRSTPIQGAVTTECQMAAFRMAGASQPTILVAHPIWGSASTSCPRNWIANWVRTVAFGTDQQTLWERNTCDAGHYVWPLDENQDGSAEAVFVGKYLLRPDGSLQCSLDTWPAADHVDGMAIADLDPLRPGLEAVAVGQTGTAMYEAATCREVWRIPTSVIRDPQHVMIAKLDHSVAVPQVVIEERGSVSNPKMYVVSAQGAVLAANMNYVMAMQNANLDGALGLDEAVGSFGQVVDRFGNLRLSKWWYWNLKGTKVIETTTGPYPNNYDRWQAFPLVFDHDGDGRDELVTWGQSLLVIGRVP